MKNNDQNQHLNDFQFFYSTADCLLLLRYTNSASTTTSCLGMLTTYTEAPVVTETTMGTDLLQTLKILTEFVVQSVGKNLRVLSIDNVLLSVEEPVRDFVLAWVGDDGDELLGLFFSKLTSTLVHVNIGLLTADNSKTATDTLDGSQSKRNFASSIDVRVHHTKNVQKLLRNDQRHDGCFAGKGS